MKGEYDYKRCLREIEDEIVLSYQTCGSSMDKEFLLELRQNMLNEVALAHQEELLETIKEFNEALRTAMKEMYEQAHRVYNDLMKLYKGEQQEVEVTAKCYLDDEYPPLHPLQDETRQDLWYAICDDDWQPIYKYGVSHPLTLPLDLNESFESFIGMNCPPSNWNEGLDRELTKDMHLIQQFHNLFDHTKLALTDFIYVRKFRTEITVEIIKKTYICETKS